MAENEEEVVKPPFWSRWGVLVFAGAWLIVCGPVLSTVIGERYWTGPGQILLLMWFFLVLPMGIATAVVPT